MWDEDSPHHHPKNTKWANAFWNNEQSSGDLNSMQGGLKPLWRSVARKVVLSSLVRARHGLLIHTQIPVELSYPTNTSVSLWIPAPEQTAPVWWLRRNFQAPSSHPPTSSFNWRTHICLHEFRCNEETLGGLLLRTVLQAGLGIHALTPWEGSQPEAGIDYQQGCAWQAEWCLV